MGNPQQVADRGHDHVPELRLALHLLHDMAEILEHDDGDGAGILELVAQLVGGVERVGVDDHDAGPQRAEHHDRILQHIGQHDRDAVALPETLALQPGGKRQRHPVHFAKRERTAHLQVGFAIGAALQPILDQLLQGAELVRDRSRAERRVDIP